MPELEKWVLHRLTELDARIRAAVQSYDWTGVYPELHNFCATDLSAFYFDIRKDAIYCDRPDSLRRRAARTVLDHLHRCLTTWLAPVLCFTAEEAWCARFGDADSVHLQLFPDVPAEWRDDALAAQVGAHPHDPAARYRADRRGAARQCAWLVVAGRGYDFPWRRMTQRSAEAEWAEVDVGRSRSRSFAHSVHDARRI